MAGGELLMISERVGIYCSFVSFVKLLVLVCEGLHLSEFSVGFQAIWATGKLGLWERITMPGFFSQNVKWVSSLQVSL